LQVNKVLGEVQAFLMPGGVKDKFMTLLFVLFTFMMVY